MHILEIDLNYTQYHPLGETYISLYPSADSKEDGDAEKTESEKSKPPMWAEVERATEEGSLEQLRNRRPNAPVINSKSVEIKAVKSRPNSRSKSARPLVSQMNSRPAPPPVDLSGLNRRQRRKALGVQDSRGKAKATLLMPDSGGQKDDADVGQDDGSDGGFFEL